MTFRRAVAALFALLALLPIEFGLEYFALAAIGQEKRAIVDYSVRSWGSRNSGYKVHYTFSTADGRHWKGSATIPARNMPRSYLRVRYLPQWPSINAAGTIAVLVFYGSLWIVPGGLLVFFSIRIVLGRDRKSQRARAIAGVTGIILILSLPLAAAEKKDYTRNVGGGLNLFSEKEERALGQRYSNDLNAKLALLGGSEAQSYVEVLGKRMIAASRRPELAFHFFVVNTREVNAFALPGGFVYVNRGLLDLAENEGQLAGVISHEIAHVDARHATKQMSKQLLLLGAVAGASAAVGSKSEKWGAVIATAGGIGAMLANLKYSRNDEYQADALAALSIAAAGYDPDDLIGFFRKMDPARSPGVLSRALAMLNTHPPTADRIRNLSGQIAGLTLNARPNATASAAFQRCKVQLAALPLPPSNREVTLSSALAAVGLGERVAVEGSLPSIGTKDQAQKVLDLPGNTVWTDAGVTVQEGQTIEVWAEGEVFIKKGSDLSCDPSGVFGSGSGFFKPIARLNTGALIGRIAGTQTGEAFPIGTHRVFRAPTPGKLEVGINDDNNFDNRGAFRVWILMR